MKINTKLVLLVLMLLLHSVYRVEARTLFRLPLASNPGYLAWFDHNGTSSGTKRYDCKTGVPYDDHHGTDFAVSSGTQIYSGAIGELYYRVDGCPDQGSLNDTCGGRFGNHVRIKHPDGLVTIYAHMKKGTPAWQSSLLCGAKVGLSGNSGRSSTPHLHFELWKNSSIGERLDFFQGSCNSVGYWVSQNYGWPRTTCQ